MKISSTDSQETLKDYVQANIQPALNPQPDDHWLWMGKTKITQNGQIKGYALMDGRTIMASRLAWLAYKGPLEGKVHVRSRCDHTLCVNPAHHELPSERAARLIKETLTKAAAVPQVTAAPLDSGFVTYGSIDPGPPFTITIPVGNPPGYLIQAGDEIIWSTVSADGIGSAGHTTKIIDPYPLTAPPKLVKSVIYEEEEYFEGDADWLDEAGGLDEMEDPVYTLVETTDPVVAPEADPVADYVRAEWAQWES